MNKKIVYEGNNTKITIEQGVNKKEITLEDLINKTKVNYRKLARAFNLNKTISLDVINTSYFEVLMNIEINNEHSIKEIVWNAVYYDRFIEISAMLTLEKYLKELSVEAVSNPEMVIEQAEFLQGMYFATAVTLIQEVFSKKDMAAIMLGLYIQTDLSKRAYKRCRFLIDLVAPGLKDCVNVFGMKIG